jgi:hypothetical protein
MLKEVIISQKVLSNSVTKELQNQIKFKKQMPLVSSNKH